jgi:hypothetical protein
MDYPFSNLLGARYRGGDLLLHGNTLLSPTQTHTFNTHFLQLRIVTIRVWHGEWPLNEGQRPNFSGVRVALGTSYTPGGGNRRAWAKRLRERSPTEISPIRNFFNAA